MKCTKCGADVDPTKKFCINCGNPIQPVKENQSVESVENIQTYENSENTGITENGENVTDVTSDVTNSTFEQNNVEKSVEMVENQTQDNGFNFENSPLLNNNMDAYSNMRAQDFQPMGYNPIPEAQPKKKSNVGKIVLIIVLCVVVLALIIGGIAGLLVYKAYKTANTLAGTWQNIYGADSEAIVEDLPQEYMDKIYETYGYAESDVQTAVDFMVSSLFTESDDASAIKVTSFSMDAVSSDDAKSEVVDSINSLFDDQLADYESEFESVFVGTYAVLDSADKIQTVEETIKDGSSSTTYETVLFKMDDTTYDGAEMIITDLCCYYYSVYQAYYTEYGTEESTAAE